MAVTLAPAFRSAYAGGDEVSNEANDRKDHRGSVHSPSVVAIFWGKLQSLIGVQFNPVG